MSRSAFQDRRNFRPDGSWFYKLARLSIGRGYGTTEMEIALRLKHLETATGTTVSSDDVIRFAERYAKPYGPSDTLWPAEFPVDRGVITLELPGGREGFTVDADTAVRLACEAAKKSISVNELVAACVEFAFTLNPDFATYAERKSACRSQKWKSEPWDWEWRWDNGHPLEFRLRRFAPPASIQSSTEALLLTQTYREVSRKQYGFFQRLHERLDQLDAMNTRDGYMRAVDEAAAIVFRAKQLHDEGVRVTLAQLRYVLGFDGINYEEKTFRHLCRDQLCILSRE